MNYNPDWIKVWPAVGMRILMKDYGRGDEVEVRDRDAIGLIGSQPAADNFLRIDCWTGEDEVKHNIVVEGKWKFGVSEKEADEAVPEAKSKAPAKKGKAKE